MQLPQAATRYAQLPMKPQNIIAQINKNVKNKQWICLVDECEHVAINSHLIQQNGLLNNISESGHLVELKMIDAHKWNKNEPPLAFQKVGIKSALSHKIFCSTHDSNIFKTIENQEADFDNLQAFLLFSYRAVCAEIRKKLFNIEEHNRLINANTLDGKIDKENLKSIVNGNELGVEDLNVLKKSLETEIANNTNQYNFYSYRYPKTEIYASSVFSATDIDYPRNDGERDLENIYLHILPLVDETLILIGYNINYTSDKTKEYCQSWSELNSKDLEFKLSELFTTNIENWGISPNKYILLKENIKKEFIKLLSENISYFGIAKKIKFNLFEK